MIDPSSRYAYITNIYENNVAILDFAQQKVIGTVPSGNSPNGISFSQLPANTPPNKEIVLPMPDVHMEDMPSMTP